MKSSTKRYIRSSLWTMNTRENEVKKETPISGSNRPTKIVRLL